MVLEELQMPERSRVTRRQLLKLAGASGMSGLAGCGGSPGSTPTSRETTIIETTRSTETEPPTETTDTVNQTDEPPSKYQINVGALYYLDTNLNCVDGEPQVGVYGTPPTSETITKHVDQFTEYDIDRMVIPLPFGGAKPTDKILRLLQESVSDVSIEIAYNARPGLQGARSVSADLKAISGIIDEVPNYATLNGRPVVTILNLTHEDDGPALHPGMFSRYESSERYLEILRKNLETQITDTPFLIGELARFGSNYRSDVEARYVEFAAKFDAITNTAWDVIGRTTPSETAYSRNLDFYRGGRAFADDHDTDFIPGVQPGYNELTQDCWESQKRIPRHPETFRDLLAMANLYATTNRLLIDSFNDWLHGTQIEPGRLGTDSYGMSFMEVVKKSQQAQPKDIAELVGSRSVYYVGEKGFDKNSGSKNQPLATIQHALGRVQPGGTVRLLPGGYSAPAKTLHAGKPDQPITIEGPPAANVHAELAIRHSHVHLLGLTFDGLKDPDEVENPASYAGKNIVVGPFTPSDEYLTDAKVLPHAVGNTSSPPVRVFRTKHSEIGEFEVIGPAGVGYLYGDQRGHNGEIVKIGRPPDQLDTHEPIDQSHDIHVHHIANLEGHPHNELVEAEPGTYDILIEYCTDAGGSAKYRSSENESPSGEAAIGIRGGSSTLRWSVVSNGHGAAVDVGVGGVQSKAEAFEDVPDDRFPGKHNSIYGNWLTNNRGIAMKYEAVGPGTSIDAGPEDQKVVCGNEYNGETMDDPDRECPNGVPESDTIGHLGGDSPWD